MANWKTTIDIKTIINNEDLKPRQVAAALLEELKKHPETMNTTFINELEDLLMTYPEHSVLLDDDQDDVREDLDLILNDLYDYGDALSIWWGL